MDEGHHHPEADRLLGDDVRLPQDAFEVGLEHAGDDRVPPQKIHFAVFSVIAFSLSFRSVLEARWARIRPVALTLIKGPREGFGPSRGVSSLLGFSETLSAGSACNTRT